MRTTSSSPSSSSTTSAAASAASAASPNAQLSVVSSGMGVGVPFYHPVAAQQQLQQLPVPQQLAMLQQMRYVQQMQVRWMQQHHTQLALKHREEHPALQHEHSDPVAALLEAAELERTGVRITSPSSSSSRPRLATTPGPSSSASSPDSSTWAVPTPNQTPPAVALGHAGPRGSSSSSVASSRAASGSGEKMCRLPSAHSQAQAGKRKLRRVGSDGVSPESSETDEDDRPLRIYDQHVAQPAPKKRKVTVPQTAAANLVRAVAAAVAAGAAGPRSATAPPARKMANKAKGKRKAKAKSQSTAQPKAKANKSKPKGKPKKRRSAKPTKRQDGTPFVGMILLGEPSADPSKPESDGRVRERFDELFGRTVEVFQAECDEQRRTLYKAVDVARLVGRPKNTISMYLMRNKLKPGAGIFQASGFKFKDRPRIDLKCGCYLLTAEACKRVIRYCGGKKPTGQ